MKKRIISILLIIAIMIPLLLMPASAAGSTARIKGVNYTRIRENTVLRKPVEFQIGSKSISGYLQNGKQLDKDEIDMIILDVMHTYKLTSVDLMKMNEVIKEASQETDVNYDHLLQLGLKFTLGVSGLSTYTDIMDIVTGKKEVNEGIQQMALGQITGMLAQYAFGAIAKRLVDGLMNCMDVVIIQILETIEAEERYMKALEYSVTLAFFYNECNNRIKDAEREQGVNTWSIVADSYYTAKTTLFGLPVTQEWRLVCDLRRTEDMYGDREDPFNYGGIYRGPMYIEIMHDMSTFDKLLLSDLLRKFPMVTLWEPIATWSDKYSASSLTKRLSSANVEIHIDEVNMSTTAGSTEYFSLAGFEDYSLFQLDHRLQGPARIGPYSNGKWDKVYRGNGGSAHANLNFILRANFSGGLSGGNRYPYLKWTLWNHDNSGSITASPGGLVFVGNSEEFNTDINLITDYHIFDDLRSGEGKLLINGG